MLTSSWHKIAKYEIRKCLVVILGIGDYKGNMNDLIGVEQDYKNIIYTFYEKFGYSVAFRDDRNNLQYCNKKPKYKLNQKKFKPKSINAKFKLQWTGDEISTFIDEIVDILSKNNHDSLFLVISSHGDIDGVILDSDCEEVLLHSIYHQFFGQKCNEMLNKPKIFLIDSCVVQ